MGWETVFGKMFWAGVAEGGARGKLCCLIPPVQESRNLCLHVKEQNYIPLLVGWVKRGIWTGHQVLLCSKKRCPMKPVAVLHRQERALVFGQLLLINTEIQTFHSF